MAKKKKTPEPIIAAEIEIEEMSDVIINNYMPYTMSVIVNRAIPEIDGFKPSHRKILYTMYTMGLINGNRTKSTNVVGQTMKLNPHGDATIYETMVRLTTGRESLLHPFVDSKGTFGKQYSAMAYAQSRYTEVKLDKFSEEIFDGIDKDAVDFKENYDNTMLEPILLPTSFPNILVSPNLGIAVGLAINICSFNLAEICDLTIEYIKNNYISDSKMLEMLKGPDFTTGAYLLYEQDKLLSIYKTGRGTFKLRSKYSYNKEDNCIEITEIPYTTTVERIKETVIKLYKENKVKDITDVRDEIDLKGLKLTIDIKRGADPDKIMAYLMRYTSLEDTFACNFNVLVGGSPKTMGILEILEEWTAFRLECMRRAFIFELSKKKDKLHLLYGLREILLDIDKAIRLIRKTENDKEVVPNLMEGFSIDNIQAEFVAEIKLRNLNREYIINKIAEIDNLEKEITELEDLITDDKKIKNRIIQDLKRIKAKYQKPRKTMLLYEFENEIKEITEEHEDYPVEIFLSKEGYFKKCTLASLRGNDVQKFKENDYLLYNQETSNCCEVLFFTNKAQVYKSFLYDFDDTKASSLGDYVPAKLGFDGDELVVACYALNNFNGEFVLFFENGKGVRIPSESYQTKTKRRKLTGAFYSGSPLIAVYKFIENKEYLIKTNASRALLVNSMQITAKSTRSSSGATIITLRKNQTVTTVELYDPAVKKLEKETKYRKTSLPAVGAIFEDEDYTVTQQTII